MEFCVIGWIVESEWENTYLLHYCCLCSAVSWAVATAGRAFPSTRSEIGHRGRAWNDHTDSGAIGMGDVAVGSKETNQD